MTAPPPAVVWMVREPNEAGGPGDPVALFPTLIAATEFTGRLEHAGRSYVIERWEVPGLE